MKNTGVLICFFILSISFDIYCQEASETRLRETGNWNGLYLRFRLTDKLYYYGEHHYRRRNSTDNLYDFVGRMRQWYNRAGLNYFFNDYFNVVVGPTLVWNYTPQPGNPDFEYTTIEPRIWHQWLLIMPTMGRVKLYHQFRFEHRWKRDNNKGAEFEYTDRYRYKIFAYIPLNKPVLENKTWFFSPSFEIFMQSGKQIVYNHFEDFRIYTGLGYILNNRVTFFGGHMWTYGQDPVGFVYNTSHIIRLNVFLNIDLRSTTSQLPQIRFTD
jgi:hypothetical protein